MIRKEIKAADPGTPFTTKVDGREYEFKINDYSNIGGYASITIIDKETDNRYYSYGWAEINGHTFISKWDYIWDDLRENYRTTDNLLIIID